MVSARGGLARAMVALGVAAGLVVTSGACTTQTQRATPATLTAAPAELGVCEPDQLARCVPGLADLEENLFGGVAVYESDSDFSSVSPSAAREAAPKECQHLPRLGASDSPELDVEYQPAKDTDGKPLSNRFPANGGEYVRVRFTVGHNGYDVTRAMGVWAHRCPMWGFAQSMSDNDIHGWLVAESAASLSRYQAGDVDYQWPAVIDTAATMLSNKVIVQVWYSTNDPSAASRNQLLSQLIGAVGRPRPHSTLPPTLTGWSQAQISSLLPALSIDVGIDTATGDKRPLGAEPGGQFWSLCPSGDHAWTPRYDPLASWQNFDQSRWDKPGKPPRPRLMISRAHGGDDFLGDLRHEIADCSSHLAERPAVCGDRNNQQFLQADSAVAEGEDAVRFTHRWMREVEVRGHSVCGEGVEAMRVAQLKGLVVIASASDGGWLFKEDTPPLPLSTLDELLAETIRRIKGA